MSDGTEEDLTKDDYVINFIKAFAALEYAMEPFKESKRDLRASYKENKFLTGDEMRQAVRAYRAIQNDIDLDDLQAMHELLKREIG